MVSRKSVLLWEQGVGELGKQMTFVAMPLVAIVSLNANAAMIAAIAIVTGLAAMLGATLNALLVNRLPLRAVVVAATVVQTVSLIAVPVLGVLGVLNIYTLIVASALATLVTPAYYVGIIALVQATIQPSEYVAYNGRVNLVKSVVSVAGPVLAGGLMLVFSPQTLLLIDAATWLVSGAVMYVLLAGVEQTASEAEPDEATGEETPAVRVGVPAATWASLGDQKRLVVASVGAEALWALARTAAMTLAVLYIVDTLLFSPSVIGIVYALGSLGFVGGSALAAFSEGLDPGRASRIAAVLALVCAAGLLITLGGRYVALGGITVFIAASAMGYITLEVSLMSWRQARLGQSLLRQVSSVADGVGTGARLGGALLAGVFATAFGVHAVLLAGGVAFAVVTVGILRMAGGLSIVAPTAVGESPAVAAPAAES